jgi:ketosteroid isomerase-like protein
VDTFFAVPAPVCENSIRFLGGTKMLKRILTVSLFLLALNAAGSAQMMKSAKKPAGPAPDKAFMQKVWDGWSTLNPSNVAQYYATGPHTFYDIAPLKYSSWDEYAKGAQALIASYKSAKFEVNDDAEFHNHGDLVWATATVKDEMTEQSGKVDMGAFRYTVVWENQDGKWLIVHEHVSAPIQ